MARRMQEDDNTIPPSPGFEEALQVVAREMVARFGGDIAERHFGVPRLSPDVIEVDGFYVGLTISAHLVRDVELVPPPGQPPPATPPEPEAGG